MLQVVDPKRTVGDNGKIFSSFVTEEWMGKTFDKIKIRKHGDDGTGRCDKRDFTWVPVKIRWAFFVSLNKHDLTDVYIISSLNSWGPLDCRIERSFASQIRRPHDNIEPLHQGTFTFNLSILFLSIEECTDEGWGTSIDNDAGEEDTNHNRLSLPQDPASLREREERRTSPSHSSISMRREDCGVEASIDAFTAWSVVPFLFLWI